MSEIPTQRAGESLMLALETAAFISPLPWEWEPPAVPQGSGVLVSIRWRGDPGGLMEIATSPEFGRYLAASQMGIGPDAEEAALRGPDALKELLNITAGLLARQEQLKTSSPLALGVPTLVSIREEESWRAFMADPKTMVLDADGHAVAIRSRSAA